MKLHEIKNGKMTLSAIVDVSAVKQVVASEQGLVEGVQG
jgi:hypothetical protein